MSLHPTLVTLQIGEIHPRLHCMTCTEDQTEIVRSLDSTVEYSKVQNSTVLCCTIEYSTVEYSTVHELASSLMYMREEAVQYNTVEKSTVQ